jgi:hypothetical protein
MIRRSQIEVTLWAVWVVLKRVQVDFDRILELVQHVERIA